MDTSPDHSMVTNKETSLDHLVGREPAHWTQASQQTSVPEMKEHKNCV